VVQIELYKSHAHTHPQWPEMQRCRSTPPPYIGSTGSTEQPTEGKEASLSLALIVNSDVFLQVSGTTLFFQMDLFWAACALD
jgi:hypothetical protein